MCMRLYTSAGALMVDSMGCLRCVFRVCLCVSTDALFVDGVVGVSQQDVGKTGLQQVHCQEGGLLHNHIQQQVDRFSVTCRHLVRLLADLQQAGGGQSQELFQAVLYAPLVDGEESSSNLVDGFGQAVDVVAVAFYGGAVL